MRCPECAYPNSPTSYNCDRCGDPLRSREEVEKTIKLWQEMPEPDRAEFEAKIRLEQARFDQYLQYLQRNRLRHIIIGGILAGVTGLFTGWFILPDIILGALAGYFLNRQEGERYIGMALFGLTYTISFLIKGSISSLWSGHIIFTAFYIAIWAGGFIFSACM
ncbi:unnamed protein product, partial [marine sediment metagenome]